MGRILYGYEGMGIPVLFTGKGLIFLQRKVEENKEAEEKDIDNEKSLKVTDQVITMQWIGANPFPKIETKDPQQAYHTYGLIQTKATCYKQIVYRNVYPGIDIVYSIKPDKRGFEYQIEVNPGADISLIKARFGGDVKSILKDKNLGLKINSPHPRPSLNQNSCLHYQHVK